MDKDFLKKCIAISLSVLVTVVLILLIYFALEKTEQLSILINDIIEILKPIIYGIIIAYLLKPICNFFTNQLTKIFQNEGKVKNIEQKSKILSITISMIIFIAFIVFMIKLILPQLISSIPELINTLFDKAKYLIEYIENHKDNKILLLIDETLEKINFSFDATEFTNQYITPYVSNLFTTLTSSAWNILMFIKNIIIGIAVAVYSLYNKDKLGHQAYLILFSLFPEKVAKEIHREIVFCDEIFNKFLVGKIIDSLIIGILAYIGCTILQMPYAILISVIIGITNIIPVFGPFIGAIPSIIFVLAISPIKALILAIFILILQQLDGNIIGPKILGQTTGVSTFWILTSIVIFGGLWGIVGMIIGIPLFAIIYDLVKRNTYKLLKKRKLNHYIDEYNNKFHKN